MILEKFQKSIYLEKDTIKICLRSRLEFEILRKKILIFE